MPEPILNNDEQRQLEWSKNWHAQRVNYMPWTEEQKAAYLRAIDSTYDEGGFTRNPYEVMGFTPKNRNININYDNAEKTTYGGMAKKSGLVHELAHKLSYNANNELNKTDHVAPTAEDALLRAKKLNRLMHPLEIGGLQNANNFVDYNANSKDARAQEKEFRKQGIYNSKDTAIDSYGHNLIEVKAKLDELRYRLNLNPEQMDIRPESVKKWRQREILPSSLDDYSDEQIAKMLNTFAYNGNSNVANYASNGGKITKYSELNDKDRWAAIRAGVRAGYTNIDDIEKAYNEYSLGGHEYATKGDLRASALYGDAAKNFTNQMWNSKAGLEARKNSNDFMTQVAALKEEERQKQFQESVNKQREKAGQFMLKKAQDEYDAMHNDWEGNPDAFDAVDAYKFSRRPETLNDVLGNYKFEDAAANANKTMLEVASIPYLGFKGVPSLLNQGTRLYYGLDAINAVNQGIKEGQDEFNKPGNLASQFVEQETTQQYNPYQQMINKQISDRSKTIQANNAATLNNGSVSTQPPIQVRPSNTGAGVRSANTSVTATTPITTNTTTTANVQQPTKMQGFMSKLGQAAPYLADFAGWTFGNSRFFNYGGNLYEVNNK